jgi:hypothetical protein
LTLTERRALYAHLHTVGQKWKAKTDPMMERKYSWFTMLRNNFREALNGYEAHGRQYQTANGVCRCRIPRACPFLADALAGYTSTGAGQPAHAEYEAMDVMLTKSFREQAESQNTEDAIAIKSNLREGLRHFYKGSMRFISEANVACETMDDLLETISYQRASLLKEPNDSQIVAKMKGCSGSLKLALQGLSTRFRQNQTSPMENDLIQKVVQEAVCLCDAIEERVNRHETKMVYGDTKGIIITVSAVRSLVGEILCSIHSWRCA